MIDVEIMEREFPEGQFIAKVHDDSFDLEMFECLYDDNPEGWTQLLVGESCKGAYVSDGQVVFVSPIGEIVWTQETAVKLAEDITILRIPRGEVLATRTYLDMPREMICAS